MGIGVVSPRDRVVVEPAWGGKGKEEGEARRMVGKEMEKMRQGGEKRGGDQIRAALVAPGAERLSQGVSAIGRYKRRSRARMD